MIVGAGRRAQRYLTAVEFVLLFTPRLVGKNAGVHPAAREIVRKRSFVRTVSLPG